MARNHVHVRDALPEDAAALLVMWREKSATTGRSGEPRVDTARRAIGRLSLDPEQRLLVAVLDDAVVGMAHLVRASLSPLHEETAVRVSHLYVRAGGRRRGVGRALLAAAGAWADEKQSGHVTVRASTAARDTNRFLTRLGLSAVATVRAAPVAALQERLAKCEAADTTEGQLAVERLRTLRRRQASARRRGLPTG